MKSLAQLRAFHYAAREGSMLAAARALGLSQPTVSTLIAKLEREYGAELFYRGGRKLGLTSLGAQLLDISHRLFELEQEASELLSAGGELQRGQLRVSAVGPFNLMPILAAFVLRYPGLRVRVNVGDSREVVQRVIGYNSDVGVLVHAEADPRLHLLPLRRQRLLVMAPRNHPLARRSRIRLQDLEAQRFIVREPGSTTRRVFEQALVDAGVRIQVAAEIGSRESIREGVAAGLGLGVVSDIAFVPDPRVVPLAIEGSDICTHAHIICLEERRESRVIAAFLRQAQELADAWLHREDFKCPSPDR